MRNDDKRHLSRVAEMGCIACERAGYHGTPAEIHHIRDGQGIGMRASNREAIPLCHTHHRTGGHGVAIHAGRETWESIHGTERELLAIVMGRL